MRRQLRLLIPVTLFACLPLFLLSCGETSDPVTSSVPAGEFEKGPTGARGTGVPGLAASSGATIMDITVPNGGTTACLPVPWAVPGQGGAITTINVTTLPSHGTMNTLQLGGSAALNCEPGFKYTNDAADNSTTDTFTITANCISGPCEDPITFHVTITPPPAEAPTISCADVTVDNAPGQCSATVTFNPTVTGVPEPAVVCTPASGSSFDVGTTEVTCTATNSAGSVTCTFDVTVNDTESPTIMCPADIEVDAGSPAGTVVIYAAVSGSDNCPGAALGQTAGLGSGSEFPIGTTTETYEFTDAEGNSTACSFAVTVLSPEEMIEDLEEDIEDLPINHGVKNALTAKLEAAAAALDNGNIDAACGALNALMNQAQAQRGKKLTEAQADELIAAAQAIMEAIPCP